MRDHIPELLKLPIIVVCDCVVDESNQTGLHDGFDAIFRLIEMTENVFQYRIGECLESRLDLSPLLGYI